MHVQVTLNKFGHNVKTLMRGFFYTALWTVHVRLTGYKIDIFLIIRAQSFLTSSLRGQLDECFTTL